MKKHIFFLIRYSVVANSGPAWRIAELSKENYLDALFSEERLNAREDTFINITLPSLLNQDDYETEATLLIFVSDLMPKDKFEKLRLKIEDFFRTSRDGIDYKIMEIASGDIRVKSKNSIYKNMNEAFKALVKEKCSGTQETLVASVRIDDDDALSKNYISELNFYLKKEFIGFIVSFSFGLEGYYQNKRISDLKYLYFPKNAQGMAYIYKYDPEKGFKGDTCINVFNTGSHMKVDERHPTIISSTNIMFFRTLSNNNDSYDTRYHPSLKPVKSKNAFEKLPFIRKLVDDKEISMMSDEDETPVRYSQHDSLIDNLNKKVSDLNRKILTLTTEK